MSHILQIFWNADWVIKFVFLVLVGFSVACWAIIFYKSRELSRWKRGARKFSDLFWRSKKLSELNSHVDNDDPLTCIFKRGFVDSSNKKTAHPEINHHEVTLASLRMNIERATEDEIERVETYLPFLATTGSFTPFIGLFGTVWGILVAFWRIGHTGSSSLAVVGPYLAEALIATAMGLAAAIPAAIFYNYFVRRTRSFIRLVENFSEDLILRVERELFK